MKKEYKLWSGTSYKGSVYLETPPLGNAIVLPVISNFYYETIKVPYKFFFNGDIGLNVSRKSKRQVRALLNNYRKT